MMVKEAWLKWIGNQGGVDPTAVLCEAFEAGWNAARAELRSDAAVPVGGRGYPQNARVHAAAGKPMPVGQLVDNRIVPAPPPATAEGQQSGLEGIGRGLAAAAPASEPDKADSFPTRYWAPDSAIPISVEAMRRLDNTGTLDGTTSMLKLEAAYLTALLAMASEMTDGRKAAMVNMIAEFTRMTQARMRVQVNEAIARDGGNNEPFMGRELAGKPIKES